MSAHRSQLRDAASRRTRRTWPFLSLLLITLVWGAQRTSAFKFETHVWIAQQVLNNIAQCRAANNRACVWIDFTDRETQSVTRRAYFLEAALASSLDHYPEAYRMGAMGPDAFPDIAGGQMTTHPGVKNHMLADDWLKWVLQGASAPKSHFVTGVAGGSLGGKVIVWDGSEQQAFALGYIAHAAGDIFAHSYVNTYAGDVFWFNDGEQEVEARHIGTEAIVRDYTPAFTDATGHDLGSAADLAFMPNETDAEKKARKSVFEFIANRLILNRTVADQYGLPAVTMAHLWAMHEVWSRQNTAIEKINSGRDDLNRLIGDVQTRIDGLKEFSITFGGCVDLGLFEVCTPRVTYTPWPSFCWVDLNVTCSLINRLNDALTTARSANDELAAEITDEIADWHDDTEQAVIAYVETSEKVVKEIMKGETGHPLTELNGWVNCYAPVFTHIDPGSRFLTCPTIGRPFQALNFVSDLCRRIGQVSSVLQWGACPMQAVKDYLEHELLDSGFVTGIVADILNENSVITQMVRLRTQNGDTATDEGRLTTEYSSSTTSKHLLVIPDIVCRLRADMQLTQGDCNTLIRSAFDPEHFAPVHNAIQLTKLSLLSAGELNRLVRDEQIGNTLYGPEMYTPTTPFNVLFGAVRSIDGNQQWQERPTRYPRADTAAGGAPSAVAVTDSLTPFGRPFSLDGGTDGGPTGFRLWQDCEANEAIFRKVFIGPVAPAIEDPTSVGLSEILMTNDPNAAGRTDPFPLAAGSRLPTKVETIGGIQHFVCGELPIVTLPNRGPATVTVTPDTTPPDLTAPPDVVVECAANGAANVQLGTPTVTDNRDSSPDVTNDAPDTFPFGDTIVHWHAEDSAGNAADRTQTVHVSDRLRPAFPALPALSITANSPTGTFVTAAPPVATDMCDGSITATRVSSNEPLSLGAHTIFWRAQDRAGNVAIARQTVTVSARRGDLDVDGDVDNNDVNIVVATRNVIPAVDLTLRDFDNDGVIDDNDRAVFALLQQGQGDPRDLNRDGVIDLLDARIIVTLCTRPRCAIQ